MSLQAPLSFGPMDSPAPAQRPSSARFVVLVALAAVLVLGFGFISHATHTATIPNVGLPASNSKSLPGLSAYDPQVSVTREYLGDLATLNYSAAYQLLAPSVRAAQTEPQFEADRKQAGVLGQATVWADDQNSTRAEYVVGRPDGSKDARRHRFLLLNEQGRWWVAQEAALPDAPPAAPSLSAAMLAYVQQRAGTVWTKSAELLRQEGFEGGQLLLFSYIDPKPSSILTAERLAILTYYVNGPGGWQFAGGGTVGLAAGMNLADVAMGFTTFGAGQQYVAYYGVVENTNAVSVSFQEPSGAGHTENVKGQKTILFVNERNPFDPLPLDHPFKSLVVKDVYGNSLRTNPDVGPPA